MLYVIVGIWENNRHRNESQKIEIGDKKKVFKLHITIHF